MDWLDKEIIILMQDEFPLEKEPYARLASELKITEAELIERLQRFQETGKIRKFGAVLTHRRIGYTANALCAWIVPFADCERVGEIMTASPAVTHCYCREIKPDWPYNFYTMIHGHSREICEETALKLAEATGVFDYKLLFSTKEWKKTSMRYFQEDAVLRQEKAQ
ncbi:MAG: Lrp/AsnC family transcriptional regulator [Sporomusaceae bacterium]|nr:Lrp/AsnC family transcriptional regulator [Sporomusaceae bacterium]